MKANILIVEDDPMVQFIHRSYLERLAVFERIFSVETVEEAQEMLQKETIELLLLDIHLKDGNGLELLQTLREQQQAVDVIMITAADETRLISQSLHLGMLDYLIKPFSFAELMARIRTMIRLSKGSQTSLLQVGDLTLDTATHTVHRANKLILLSAKEYALLEYMLLNKNIVLSRETIEEHIWDFDYAGGTNLVDVYISYLRKKIDGASTCKLIHTVRGSGYVIKEPS